MNRTLLAPPSLGNLPRRLLTAVAGAFIILLPVPYVLQGIDFTDTGWILSNFQGFFRHPQSVSYWFHMWLTYATGASWYALLGHWGLFGMKLGAVAVYLATFAIAGYYYRGRVTPFIVTVGLALGATQWFANRIVTIHYNSLGTMIYLASAAALVFGLEANKRLPVALSGALLMLGVFVRLPNLAQFLMPVGVALIYLVRRGLPATLLSLAVFALGSLTAVGLVLAIQVALGHFDLYVSSLQELFSSTKDDTSHYGLIQIERRFLRDHGRVIVALGAYLLFARAAKSLTSRLKSPVPKILLSLGIGALIGFLLPRIGLALQTAVFGFLYITSISALLTLSDRDSWARATAVITIIGIATFSLGSDGGIGAAEHLISLFLPFALWYWSRPGAFHLQFGQCRPISMSFVGRAAIVAVFLGAITLHSFTYGIRATYRDSADRSAMTASVDHHMLKWTWTTQARAEVIGEMLAALEPHVDPGDYLLTFESAAMTHFLLESRPFGRNPWPILYTPSELRENLEADAALVERLPPALIATTQMRSSAWPAPLPLADNSAARGNRRVIDEFLLRYDYVPVWQNRAFILLLPEYDE